MAIRLFLENGALQYWEPFNCRKENVSGGLGILTGEVEERFPYPNPEALKRRLMSTAEKNRPALPLHAPPELFLHPRIPGVLRDIRFPAAPVLRHGG